MFELEKSKLEHLLKRKAKADKLNDIEREKYKWEIQRLNIDIDRYESIINQKNQDEVMLGIIIKYSDLKMKQIKENYKHNYFKTKKGQQLKNELETTLKSLEKYVDLSDKNKFYHLVAEMQKLIIVQEQIIESLLYYEAGLKDCNQTKSPFQE